jgi:hypothetical protein
MAEVIQHINGVRIVYELQDDETWCIFAGKIVVCHPEKKPRMLIGTAEMVELDIEELGRHVDIKDHAYLRDCTVANTK